MALDGTGDERFYPGYDYTAPSGRSGGTLEVTETAACSASAPTDLAANATSPTQVDLTWTYDGTNNDYYTIYRGGTQIATNVTTGSYTDSTVAAGTAYSYTVRGHNNTGACDSADSNVANVTTPACTELTPSSISFNGVNTAAGDFSGASMVTPVDLMNLEFRVTEGTGGGAPFSQTDNFDANNFGNWIPSDTNTSNNWLLDANTTPSSNVGPSGDHTGGGYYAYTESSSGSYPETYWLTSNVLDGSTYALNLDFWWNMNTDTDLSCELHVDVSTDGGTNWTNSVWSRTNNPNSGDVWVNQNVDLSAYTSNNLEVRFRTISSSWRCDTALDDIVISGPARATEVERLAWNPDPQEASAILTNGNSYNLYARGTDPECGTVYYVGGTTTPGNSQAFTWSSCTETATLNAPTFSPTTTPITGPVTVTATGTATGIQVSWSEDGGATWSAWFANGATYTPTSCITGNVIFRAQGTGTCGTLTAQSAAAAFDTTDKDVATLTTTNPSPATGVVTIQTAVGVETAPATLTGVSVTIGGSSACNVTGAAMTWNGTTSRWEYSWDTSACGTSAAETTVTIDVTGTDPDCGTVVNAVQLTGVTIDNTCVDGTPSTITIAPGQTVGGTAVDLTTLFSTTGNVGSFTYKINGTTVTSPWDSSAYGTTGPQAVTFEVTGTDPDCGDIVGPVSNSITVNNALGTDAGVAGVASKNKQLDVTAP
ncbi:hypothetical protein C2E25_11175, partial [Geothermobacter hydrogeniphilus]